MRRKNPGTRGDYFGAEDFSIPNTLDTSATSAPKRPSTF
jgi:hypothetical protein